MINAFDSDGSLNFVAPDVVADLKVRPTHRTRVVALTPSTSSRAWWPSALQHRHARGGRPPHRRAVVAFHM